ncbi:MAG: Phosphoribosylformimino-5-aminoimidazole carboxamide ribotide isomerase [uncultured Sphingomonas sp.]|uniref:1-(5-phosphoribosyl)-5-[(5-phosphoribosylamino)methylideneamino] imidazole-4-carboxamide isomerase n=1 Tax=uncultured Sphingomonas sp. TaxID=158754 RepID=A0A6J4TAR6_9SPHN|nr:MAG: Phosphoribosylformimino-5-aminoimidazole carboxamide ribotide isomerase [uncultured Sphingomonas sp.]
MIIYPAMDLMGGAAVRLKQGRFEDQTRYETDPAQALRDFAGGGAVWAHVVDLDGARAREPVQHGVIGDLAHAAEIKLQVAGGIRTAGHIARLFERGVARAVVGSLCVSRPELVNSFLESFGPERITLALDVRLVDRTPMVATHGWQTDSASSLWEVAARFPSARHLLLTDIGRDGMLEGPNFVLYEEAATRLPQLEVQASGGVSSLDDLSQLRTAGAIVGKALWEGRFTLEEALARG